MILRSRFAWIAALLVFMTAGYIRNTRPGWNVNSQFALTLAMVERGTLSIDAYHGQPGIETEDKAFFEGHFYTDKSPVTPLLGVPALVLYKALAGAPENSVNYHTMRYWTTVGSIGVWAAGLALMLTQLLARVGVDERLAAAASALWIAGTPLMGYSILFFNYVPACAFLVGGFLLAWPFIRTAKGHGLGDVRTFRLMLAGFLIGVACWTLQTVALLALILTIALLVKTPRVLWVSLWPWAVGGMLGVAGFVIYSLAIFGEITSPYRYEFHEVFKAGMEKGLMGATWPSLKVIQLITIHPFRGLFILFPCTALALCGTIWALRDGARRSVAMIALAFLAGLILYNGGYYMWWGGWTYAPRHLIPAVPLLAVGMAPLLSGKPPWRRPVAWVLAVTLVYSAIVNVMVVSLDPQPPPGVPQALLLRPELVAPWPTPFFDLLGYVVRGQTDVNWGNRMGLKGVWSLMPLGLVWLLGMAAIFFRMHAQTDRRSPPIQP